jgi:molybdopterin synthase sulfur carrier subunit
MSEAPANTITVRVLFFGAARDAAGVSKAAMDVIAPVKVNAIKERVFQKYECLSPFAKSVMVSVNEEYASDETTLKDRDVVAFLPPVSGG